MPRGIQPHENPTVEAFRTLIRMAEARTKARSRMVGAAAPYDFAHLRAAARQTRSLVIGAEYIREMSGCWHPDDRDELLDGGWDERLDALVKRWDP